MALLKNMLTVSVWTAGSRVLGFVRDILIAQTLGTGVVADVFFVAFRLPNLFRRVFGEGAFNAAFVPLFARRLEQEGEAAARDFAEEALALLTLVLIVLTVVVIVTMPWFIVVIGSGFLQDEAKYALGVELSRITFPYLMFIALMALYGGVLNALYRFKAAAGAPILLNVFLIAALLLVIPFVGNEGPVLAWTVTLAGVAQCAVVAVAAWRAGMKLRLRRPRLTPGMRRLLALMGPGLLAAAVLQINLLVGTNIATFQEGAVSFLYYADRIYQLPLGLIGIAFGIVLLPDLSRKLRAGAEAEAMASFNRGVEFSLLFALPAAVALSVIAKPIIVVLFQHGAFGPAASEATAVALAAFALGLPAYVLVKVLQPGFFAREDTKTPLIYGAVSVATNIVLALLLFFPLGWGHVGLALATAAAAWVNTLLLGLHLGKRRHLVFDARLIRRIPRIVLASALMGAGLWAGAEALQGWLAGALWSKAAALAMLVAGGLALYGLLVLLLRAASLSDVRGLVSRRP